MFSFLFWFLLVFCSFTWSSEKINLNMIQVIKGHLVKSFDEEFRMLYARSSAPAELCPPDTSLPGTLLKPPRNLDRKDLRRSLDVVARKTCERTMAVRDYNHRLLEGDGVGPSIRNEICVPDPGCRLFSAGPVDLKRHSYAGEIQDRYVPHNIWPRGSNWNINQDAGHAANKNLNKNLCALQRSRGHAFPHGEEALTMLQTPPTPDNASKSHMRTLRIESYLQATDVPSRDPCDYQDEYEQLEMSSRMTPGRTRRTPAALRPNIQEQMELSRHAIYAGPRSPAMPKSPLQYSSMQWSPAMAETQMSPEEFQLKRKSLQILDRWNGVGYGQGRNACPPGYSSLSRPRGGAKLGSPDVPMDGWHKRHSMADARSYGEYGPDFCGNTYEDFATTRVNRSATGLNAQNGQYQSNLNEEQRSQSHYDVKGIVKSPNIWQDPPSRTASAAALLHNKADVRASNVLNSQHFPNKSSNQIKSLLNIPERREDARTAESYSNRSASSTHTLTAEDESPESVRRPQKLSKSLRLSPKQRGNHSKSWKGQSVSEERPGPKSHSFRSKSTCAGSWHKDDRQEPYASAAEKRNSVCGEQSNSKSLAKGGPEVEIKLSTRGHHENKLERFLQRMGNLIHKNK